MNKEYFIKTPNIPTGKVSCVLVDYRINKTSENALKNRGIKVLKTAKLNSLYESVDGHPDMQIHHLGNNLFACEETLLSYYQNLIPDAEILPGVKLCEKYPYDIAFNACRVGNFLFHNLNFTDCRILEYYKTNGVKLINVKQGYSKCSVCVINEKTIITSDIKMSEKAKENGLDALFYDNTQIILKNLSKGFVGGISGLIDKNILAINGNIKKLDNNKRLLDFCQNHHVSILSLYDGIPEDIGSILPIKQL